MDQSQIIRENIYGSFTVRIMQDKHGKYSVNFSCNETQLQIYDCEDLDHAKRDFNTVCDTMRNTVKIMKQSLVDLLG